MTRIESRSPNDAQSSAAVDELLDRAIRALNRGNRERANELAGRILAADADNPDAEDLLSAPDDSGEIRRLTILFCDLVGSTELSTRLDPEAYRTVVGRYRDRVHELVEARYDGHITSTKGDGILAVFGHPQAHEDDVRRAVQAGLEITRAVDRLSDRVERQFGLDVAVRVAVHRGIVYLDRDGDDVYGFAANLAARLEGLAPANGLVVSDSVRQLVDDEFDLSDQEPVLVKGVAEPVHSYLVRGEEAPPPLRSRAWQGPLVGRGREQDWLAERWESVVERRTGAIHGIALRGEAGIGKTRLAAALVDRVADEGGVIVELVGSSRHAQTGLHPVRALLERRCKIDLSADGRERLSRLRQELDEHEMTDEDVRMLAPVLGVGPEAGYVPVELDGRKLEERIAETVDRYVRACLGEGPSVVLVEDLHWFDTSTRDLVRRLLAGAGDQTLVLITVRPGVGLPGGAEVDVVDLEPLTEAETAAAVDALGTALPPDVRSRVIGRSDGIPLYIEQLVAGADRPHSTDRFDDRLVDALGVPEALYEPLVARLQADEEAVPVVAAAATIGRDVDLRLLRSVTQLDNETLESTIADLARTLVLEPGDDSGRTWRFRHELVREVAYELQAPRDRRSRHGRIADALVAGLQGGVVPDWLIVAGHYERADRRSEAASAYGSAAEDARRRGALAEAGQLLGRAIEQVEQVPAAHARDRQDVGLRLRRGFLAVAAEGNSSAQAVADFERCLELAGSDVHGDEMFSTLVSLWGYYASRADLTRARQVLELLRATLDREREFLRPENEAGFGMVDWFAGDFTPALDRLEAATALAGGTHRAEVLDATWYLPNDPVGAMHAHLALARFVQGDIAGAESALDAAVRRVEQLAFPQGPFSLAYVRSLEIWLRIELGDLARASELANDLAEHAERHGFDSWSLVSATQRAAVDGLVAVADDDSPELLSGHASLLATFVDSWEMLGVRAFVTVYLGVLGRLLIASGRVEEARRRLDAGLALGEETGMRFYDAELIRVRAHTESDPAVVSTGLAAAIECARRQGCPIFLLRAAIDHADRSGDAADPWLAEAIDVFPTGSGWPELKRALAGPR